MPNFKQHRPKLSAEEQKKKDAATGRVSGLLQDAIGWEGRQAGYNPPPFAWGTWAPKGVNATRHLDLHGVEADVVNGYLFGWAKRAYEQTIFIGRDKANIRSVLDTIRVDDPVRRKKAKASLAGSLDKVIELVGAYADVPVSPSVHERKEWEELEDYSDDAEYWFAQSETKVGYLERLLIDAMDEVELASDTFAKLHLLSEHLKQHVHRIDSGGSSSGYLRPYSKIRREWVRHLAIVWREFLGEMPTVHSYQVDNRIGEEAYQDNAPDPDEAVLSVETEKFLNFAGDCCYQGDEAFAKHILDPANKSQTENRIRHALRGFNPRPKDAGPPW